MSYVRKRPSEFPEREDRKKRQLPKLPLAKETPKVQAPPTKEELKAQYKADRSTLNLLRLALMPVMKEMKNQYRLFRMSAIADRDIEYLYQENDPGFISSDLTEEQRRLQGLARSYEISKDKHGNPGLLQTETGKFFYNCNTQIIEQRLSNGNYKRPKEFLWDVKSIMKDAKQLGSPENMLKANNMWGMALAEVELIELQNPQLMAQCEAVFVREQRRAELEKEKLAQLGGQVNSLNIHPPAPDSTVVSGPVVLGEMLPRTKPDEPMPDVPTVQQASNNTVLTNGETVPSQLNGSFQPITMISEGISSGTRPQFPPGYTATPSNPTTATQEFHSHPSLSASSSSGQNTSSARNSQNSSGPHLSQYPNTAPSHFHPFTQSTTGATQQDSQQPSQFPDWSHMYPDQHPSDESGLPDTHPNSDPSSKRNTMSDPEALALLGRTDSGSNGVLIPPPTQIQPDGGSFKQPVMSARAMNAAQAQAHGPVTTAPPTTSLPTSMTAQQQPATSNGAIAPSVVAHHSSILELVNPPTPPPPFKCDEDMVSALHTSLAWRTEGLTVEQLEMVDARCMDVVWRRRGQWDRGIVMDEVKRTVEEVLEDVEWQRGLVREVVEMEE
jgi:ATPase family AAA domain-containing protein 2